PVVGRLADGQLGPIGRLGARRDEEAVLDLDLIGREDLRRLGAAARAGRQAVAGGVDDDRRGVVAVEQDDALLEGRAGGGGGGLRLGRRGGDAAVPLRRPGD